MRVISYSQLRRTLTAELDSVNSDHGPVIVTRTGGKPAAVWMSLDDFNSWQETVYLLRSPANAKQLRKSIAEAESGKVRTVEFDSTGGYLTDAGASFTPTLDPSPQGGGKRRPHRRSPTRKTVES